MPGNVSGIPEWKRALAQQQAPILSVVPEILHTLAGSNRLVLEAPPGAGKTTGVPLALLDAPWRGDGKVIVLEPRRIAARAAAVRMAHLMGEAVGKRVGYRVRLENKVSAETRIEVVTEGILTRMLQDDPELPNVAAVLFDEFHERSVHTDLALALALDVQESVRPDLRLVLMSATLQADALAGWFESPCVRAEGKTYPVEVRYLPPDQAPTARTPRDRLLDRVPKAVLNALSTHPEGDILVFLPGRGEIRAVEEALVSRVSSAVRVLPFHGDLTLQEQEDVLRIPPKGQRNVVLATALAESSLTVPGVRVVIDGGYARVPRYNPRTGFSPLLTVPVSKAAATQRAGRAGRVAPGVAYRLWTLADDAHLPEAPVPEIEETDLTPLALELAAWGTRHPAHLKWPSVPPETAFQQAVDVLRMLGAIDAKGGITALGKKMVALGTHPRLAHLMVSGVEAGCGETALWVAALLSERDPLRTAQTDCDLLSRLDAVRKGRVDVNVRQRIRSQVDAWRGRLGLREGQIQVRDVGFLVGLAYPERVAQAEGNGRFRMASGHRVQVHPDDPLARADWLAVAHVEGPPGKLRAALASAIPLEDVQRLATGQTSVDTELTYDPVSERVLGREVTRWQALVLREVRMSAIPPEQMLRVLCDEVRRKGWGSLELSANAERLRARIAFLRHHVGEPWPEVSEASLLASLEEWLGAFVSAPKRLADLTRGPHAEALRGLIPWNLARELDRLAPEEVTLPSGRTARLDYSDPEDPVLAVKLQEVFGMMETPSVLDGRVPVVMHLLSPARRPVQITRDLASFWKSGYFDVRKDLRGRYPKHAWPEDPLRPGTPSR